MLASCLPRNRENQPPMTDHHDIASSHTRSTSKQMITCFFGKTGHVAIVPLEQRRTINSEWCTTICLPVVFKEIRKTNRQWRITLYHDNASLHISAQTTGFLSSQNIDLMSHSPYSCDLAPNDFFLFPYVKNKMRGQRFFNTWRSGWCVQNACFETSSIRVAKVLRQLFQTHAKVYTA